MYDKILETILNVYRVPQELLTTNSNNLSSIKIQDKQFKKKIESKRNKLNKDKR